MKRSSVIRTVLLTAFTAAVIMVCTVCKLEKVRTSAAVVPKDAAVQTAGTDPEPAIPDADSAKLSSELKRALSDLSDSDTVDVYVYFDDRNAEETVMAQMREQYPDLYKISIDDNPDVYSEEEILLAIETKRALFAAYYQESNPSAFAKAGGGAALLFVSEYSPMCIATLRKDAACAMSRDDRVKRMDLFMRTEVSAE